MHESPWDSDCLFTPSILHFFRRFESISLFLKTLISSTSGDQHRISPRHTKALSPIQAMQMKEMIGKDELS